MLVVSLSPREVKYIVVHNMYDSGYGVEVEDKAGSIIFFTCKASQRSLRCLTPGLDLD